MRIKKLPNGHLLVPRPAEGPDGIIGDGVIEIGPADPDYAEWLREHDRVEAFMRQQIGAQPDQFLPGH